MSEPLRYQFERLLQAPPAEVDLARAAMYIAAEFQPGLDIDAELAALDALGDAAKAHGDVDDAAALAAYLRDEGGFRGNAADYYSVANSLLNRVLETRRGIPITLAIVYIAVGQRLGLHIDGIGFPGHFLIAVTTAGDAPDAPPVLVDPFASEVVTREACMRKLRATHGGSVGAAPEYFRPATPTQILLRVLENLKQIQLRGTAVAAALTALEWQLLIAPESHELHAQQELLARELLRQVPPNSTQN